MTASLRASLQAKHKLLIEQTNTQLATNFETPAPRIISMACAQIGIGPGEWREIADIMPPVNFRQDSE